MRTERRSPSLRRALALGLVPLLGLGVSCDKGPEQSPQVVVVQSGARGQTVRICPVCHRRFFGEQRTCTVDGSPLMDFHEESKEAPGATAEASHAEAHGDASADDAPVLSDAAPPPAPAPGAMAETASLPRGASQARSAPAPVEVEPVRVRTGTGAEKAWEPPPSAEPIPSAAVQARPAPEPMAPTPMAPAPVATPAPALAQAPTPTPAPPFAAPPAPAKVAATPPPVKVAALPPAASAKEILEGIFADEGQAAAVAGKGKLSAAEIGALKSVGRTPEDRFTSSRSLLVLQFKASGDTQSYGAALEELLLVPTNQYNPTIRLEEAEYHLGAERWVQAIDAATTAERYRQKFPRGDLYYSRLARTYEVLAKSYEGRFTTSEDPDDLDLAIRMWQRYLTHVEQKADAKRIKMAQENIAKLERIKERVL